MKIPTKKKSELYRVSKTETAFVHVTDNGRYRVSIKKDKYVLEGEKPIIEVKDDMSFEFDTFEEVKKHLLENASEDFLHQFE